MTDQEIVQRYADEDRLRDLPPGTYRLTETIVLPPAA